MGTLPVVRRGLNWLMGTAIALLILVALYVAVGRELVPMVAEYRLELETRASELLGENVMIGQLSGSWQGFSPVLVASDVQLGEQHESAILLDRIELKPALWSSLLAWQLNFADVRVNGLQLHMQEDETGRWGISGWKMAEREQPLDIPRILTEARRIHQVTVLNSRLVVEAHEQDALTLSYINFTLNQGQSQQLLQGRFVLPDGNPVSLKLQTRVKPEEWQKAPVRLYLSFPQTDWTDWLPASLTGNWQVDELEAGGELWLSSQGWQLDKATLRLHAPSVKGHLDGHEAIALEDISGRFYVETVKGGRILFTDGLALTHDDRRIDNFRFRVDESDEDNAWKVAVEQLDLDFWRPLAEQLVPMPEAVHEWVVALHPTGRLNNATLTFFPGRTGAERLTFATNLDSVGFSGHRGVPAVTNVSGTASGNLGQGELQADSRDFSLHLEQFFPEPWVYSHAQTRFAWRWDENEVRLSSPFIRAEGEEGKLAGNLLISLMRDPALEDSMELTVRMLDGDASYTRKYLPTRTAMNKQLAKWLETAIHAGRVKQGYFQIKGDLRQVAQNMTMYFDVDQAELAFQPGWPVLRDADARVKVAHEGVWVRLGQASLLDSRISDATATVMLDQPLPHHLLIEGNVSSSVQDVLTLLDTAPIGTADIVHGWQGSGALNGQLELDIPLGGGGPVRVVADAAASNATLRLAQPVLNIQAITGQFRFDTRTGLSADKVQASVFDRPVQGSIKASGSGGKSKTEFDLKGTAQVAQLQQWLGVKQAVPASGLLPYRLRMQLMEGDSWLRVDSNLNGVTVDLPEPFGKKAGEQRYADFRMTLGGKEKQRYWLDYQNLLSLTLLTPAEGLKGASGELRLGGAQANLTTRPGINVRGQLSLLDWDAWLKLVQRYKSVGEDVGDQSLLGDIQLDIGRFDGFGQSVGPLHIDARRAGAAWQMEFDSRLAKGQVTLPAQANVPIDLNLAYVRLPTPQQSTDESQKKEDILKNVDPKIVPAMNVRIAEFSLGEKTMNNWSLKIRPDGSGLRFDDLDLNLLGLHIGGSAGWSGQAGNMRSWYKGRLSGDDLSDVLKAWDYAPTVTSKTFRLDVDGNWPGSPLGFAPEGFTGMMSPALRTGQFVDVQGGAQVLRIFGVLNFNTIGRRLRLDFSDLLGKGLSYDRFKGTLQAENGVYTAVEPITMTGPSGNMDMTGRLDMRSEKIDAKIVVMLQLTNNLPLAALIAGAPAIGGALFVVDKLLGDKMARFASVEYRVTGDLSDPQITFNKL